MERSDGRRWEGERLHNTRALPSISFVCSLSFYFIVYSHIFLFSYFRISIIMYDGLVIFLSCRITSLSFFFFSPFPPFSFSFSPRHRLADDKGWAAVCIWSTFKFTSTYFVNFDSSISHTSGETCLAFHSPFSDFSIKASCKYLRFHTNSKRVSQPSHPAHLCINFASSNPTVCDSQSVLHLGQPVVRCCNVRLLIVMLL